MRVTQHPSLKAFNTFGVEASSAAMIELENEEDLLSLPSFDPERDFVLGGGSNVLFTDDIPGTVYLVRMTGKDIVGSGTNHVSIEAGAGENWHALVRWTLEQGLSGIENLSLIPGLCGAAPIQNIGAYGVELASVLESVTAWDLHHCNWTTFTCSQCELAYRDSRFKSREPGRYLITSIRLRLSRHFAPQLDYAGLKEELSTMGLENPSATDVSDAVTRIRQRKLPDPAITGNAGSFFKNPIVPNDQASKLSARYDGLPAWPAGDRNMKLSAAWMIEFCGFKGWREGDAGVSDQHSLIIVNHGSATGRQIFNLSKTIQKEVRKTFGILLEPEPRIIPFQPSPPEH